MLPARHRVFRDGDAVVGEALNGSVRAIWGDDDAVVILLPLGENRLQAALAWDRLRRARECKKQMAATFEILGLT